MSTTTTSGGDDHYSYIKTLNNPVTSAAGEEPVSNGNQTISSGILRSKPAEKVKKGVQPPVKQTGTPSQPIYAEVKKDKGTKGKKKSPKKKQNEDDEDRDVNPPEVPDYHPIYAEIGSNARQPPDGGNIKASGGGGSDTYYNTIPALHTGGKARPAVPRKPGGRSASRPGSELTMVDNELYDGQSVQQRVSQLENDLYAGPY